MLYKSEILYSSVELSGPRFATCFMLNSSEHEIYPAHVKITGCGSLVGSVSASQAAVSGSILASFTFFCGQIISIFR